MSAVYSRDVDIERQTSKQSKVKDDDEWKRRWTFGGWTRRAPVFIPLKARARAHSLNDSATKLRHEALRSLFGLPAVHMSEWAGLLGYFYHLECCFQGLLDLRFKPIWTLIGRDPPSASFEVWHWCLAVIDAYEASTDQDPSIERIYQQIALKMQSYSPSNEEKKYVLQAIFAVLCWTSATLRPVVGEEAIQLPKAVINSDSEEETSLSQPAPVLVAENCSYTYASTDIRRPTSKIFYSYRPRADRESEQPSRNVGPAIVNTASGYNSGDMLYESSLNYSSLSMIGRVRIKWVDTLTAHLAFDGATRELSVYRYPSLCATKILSSRKVQILESITEKLLPSQFSTSSGREPDSIYREVLLSYRLLFGQSHKSRKILNQIFSRLSADPGHPPHEGGEAIQNNNIDPFLKELCTVSLHTGWSFLGLGLGRKPQPALPPNLFPTSSLNVHDELIEFDTYSARDDFPTFGVRLLTLQNYNMRRQPSRVRDLWRDRRNPLQWYTFWAVIWVGMAGITLGLLQLVTGVVQMVYAIHPAS